MIMDKLYYREMTENLEQLIREKAVENKRIYLFGHCNATEELADLFLARGFSVCGILDNNQGKHGREYRGIGIFPPTSVLAEPPACTIVCIAARAYASMADQLKCLGYTGSVRKMVDYNSYAEYSLSEDTIARKKQRVERGIQILENLKKVYPESFQILCPFSALGDIYFMMSYLPYFLQKRKIKKCVIGVIGKACRDVVSLFGRYQVVVLAQKDMDEAIQAALYTEAREVFIPHQDRPYVVNLPKALYLKLIPLEKIYCCGVFGLPASTKPFHPVRLGEYPGLEQLEPGKTVIFAPYAKSVTTLKPEIWARIVAYYRHKGYACYTNTSGDETPLSGTVSISPGISEIRSVVERAGIFIGIRSGLCDVIREADCRKIALYPDYYYCDTKWKAVDMYWIEGWENIVVGENFQWDR